MTIEKLSAIQTVQPAQNIKKIKEYSNVKTVAKNDDVSISPKAKEALELSKLVNKIAANSSIRADKVADAKQKVANGFYLSETVTAKVAEKIAEFLV